MNTHRSSVAVDKCGIKVVPETLVMTSLYHVHWGCDTSHRFSIEFDGATPFGRPKLSHDQANKKTTSQQPRTVRAHRGARVGPVGAPGSDHHRRAAAEQALAIVLGCRCSFVLGTGWPPRRLSPGHESVRDARPPTELVGP